MHFVLLLICVLGTVSASMFKSMKVHGKIKKQGRAILKEQVLSLSDTVLQMKKEMESMKAQPQQSDVSTSISTKTREMVDDLMKSNAIVKSQLATVQDEIQVLLETDDESGGNEEMEKRLGERINKIMTSMKFMNERLQTALALKQTVVDVQTKQTALQQKTDKMQSELTSLKTQNRGGQTNTVNGNELGNMQKQLTSMKEKLHDFEVVRQYFVNVKKDVSTLSKRIDANKVQQSAYLKHIEKSLKVAQLQISKFGDPQLLTRTVLRLSQAEVKLRKRDAHFEGEFDKLRKQNGQFMSDINLLKRANSVKTHKLMEVYKKKDSTKNTQQRDVYRATSHQARNTDPVTKNAQTSRSGKNFFVKNNKIVATSRNRTPYTAGNVATSKSRTPYIAGNVATSKSRTPYIAGNVATSRNRTPYRAGNVATSRNRNHSTAHRTGIGATYTAYNGARRTYDSKKKYSPFGNNHQTYERN